MIIPVMEERLVVNKRTVETGRARVHITVSEHEKAVEAMLMRQDVVIERVPVGRDITEAPAVRTEGDTIVVPILEERLVLVKQLVLKEELRIRIGNTPQPMTQSVSLRREHAEIEQIPEQKTLPTGEHP